MAIFVINEWLWHDLGGDNGAQNQKEAAKVLARLPGSEHQIVVVVGSPFDQKAFALCRTKDPMVQSVIGRTYVKGIRQNSQRCLLLNPQGTVDLPSELAPLVKADDHYLVKALLSVKGAVLATTDGDLRGVLTKAEMKCISREEFIANILGA